MPGIVGLVRSDGADVETAVAAAARKMQHLDSLTMRAATFGGVGLAQVWRDSPQATRDGHDDEAGGIAIRVAGHVLQDGPSPRRLSARDIAEAYRSAGRVPAEDYDGAFTIVVVDRGRRRLSVSNDRISALPVYFARNSNSFAFAPEIKSVLAATDLRPRLHQDGLVSLLAFGYCLGRTTLFAGVSRLEPASTLTVDLETLEHRSERHWNLRFQTLPSLRKRAHAEAATYETLLASQRLILCDDPHAYELLLSGGLDSRGVLAVADSLGRPPASAFTWGAKDPALNSDAFVAQRIAESYRVPHRYLAYETSDFVANAREWVYISELANDNVGWCAEGQPTLAHVYRTGAAFTIAGDVVWDSGGFVFSKPELRQNVLLPGLSEAMTACLRTDAVDYCRGVFDAEIEGVLASCPHDELTDRKDYLYLNARVAGFIVSLGYYREHAIEVRRPFVTNAALDLFAGLPQKHRVEKNIYVAMLRRRFPRVMAIPEQSVVSLPDWNHDLRMPGPLREYFRRYLDRERVMSGALGAILDGNAFEARRDAYFNYSAEVRRTPLKSRFPLRRRVLPYVQRHRTLDHLSRLVRQGSGVSRRFDFDVLRSIALVTMLEESIARFGDRRSR